MLLTIIAIGIAGLVGLQLAQRTPSARTDERTMVQSAAQKNEAPAPLASPIQRITGDLVNRDEEYPEVGQPFTFQLTNYSQGAIFELDPGDGSPRQVFKDGRLRYTYKKAGNYQISLWARFEGEEVKLKTISKKVVVPPATNSVKVGTLMDL